MIEMIDSLTPFHWRGKCHLSHSAYDVCCRFASSTFQAHGRRISIDKRTLCVILTATLRFHLRLE